MSRLKGVLSEAEQCIEMCQEEKTFHNEMEAACSSVVKDYKKKRADLRQKYERKKKRIHSLIVL